MDLQRVSDLALRTEHAAGDSYRAAGATSTDLGTRVVMNTLAQWEASHCDAFHSLLDALVEGSIPPPAFAISAEVSDCLAAVTHRYPFLLAQKGYLPLAGRVQPCEEIALALDIEFACVLFYSGIRMAARDPKVGQAIDLIIQEEMKHVKLLSSQTSK